LDFKIDLINLGTGIIKELLIACGRIPGYVPNNGKTLHFNNAIETAENLQRSLCLAFHSVKMSKEPRKESGLGIVRDSSYP
jgi:hypothetical protein